MTTVNASRISPPSTTMVLMATGTYQRFIPPLVESAQTYLRGLKEVVVLADQRPPVGGLEWGLWGHFDWPLSTLSKFRAVTSHSSLLTNAESILLIDADMLFVGEVQMPPATGTLATLHPYYVGAPRADLCYEDNATSIFAVASSEGEHYFCGGVLGGDTSSFLMAAESMAKDIDSELKQHRIPIWHDESVWNRYCIDKPPATIWGPEYCTPEKHAGQTSRILALDKPEFDARSGAGNDRTVSRWSYSAVRERWASRKRGGAK